MERKRVAGRFVREGLDGDRAEKQDVSKGVGGAPRPKNCRTFTRAKVAEARREMFLAEPSFAQSKPSKKDRRLIHSFRGRD